MLYVEIKTLVENDVDGCGAEWMVIEAKDNYVTIGFDYISRISKTRQTYQDGGVAFNKKHLSEVIAALQAILAESEATP